MLPAVGYDHADQSHFTSRHFWEVGALDPHCAPAGSGACWTASARRTTRCRACRSDGQLAPALATARNPVAAIDKPEDVGFWTPGAWGPAEELAVPAFTAIGRALLGSRDPAVAQAAQAAAFAGGVRDALAPLGADGKPTYTPAAAYPQSTRTLPAPARRASRRCSPPACRSAPPRSAPRAPTTRTPTRPTTLPKNLKLTFDSLLAFQRDLEARGLADRVLTLVWSEFGRRAQENGSGTDHGAAGFGFLIGTRAAGRMIGEFPGLAQLDKDGNLRATSDFRGLYGALCGDWFGVDPAAVLPGARGHRPAGDPQVKWSPDLASFLTTAASRSLRRRRRPRRPRGCSSRRPSSASRSRARRSRRARRSSSSRSAARTRMTCGSCAARARARAAPRCRRRCPGGVAEWRGKLTRGRWTLYCSLPGHKAAGMRATLTVK